MMTTAALRTLAMASRWPRCAWAVLSPSSRRRRRCGGASGRARRAMMITALGCASTREALACALVMMCAVFAVRVESKGQWRVAVVDVSNAADVILYDPLGRCFPCRDTSCKAIPGAKLVREWPVQAAATIPRTHIDITSPTYGHYELKLRGLGGSTFIQFTSNREGANCSEMDAMQTRRGRMYWWSAVVDSGDGSGGCQVHLERRAAPAQK